MKLNFLGVYTIILLFLAGVFGGHELGMMNSEVELAHAEKVMKSCNQIIIGKSK